MYSVRISRASLSPCLSHCLQRRTASSPLTPSMSSPLVMPSSISSGLSPPRWPTLRDANLRSNCGMSRSTPGKLFLRTGTSKQLPLKVTRTLVPSRASDSVSASRSTPWVSVTVSLGECTVTTVTRASLLRPSVSMSRYLALPRRSPKSLHCSPFGSMSASAEVSPSLRSLSASARTESALSLTVGFMTHTLLAEVKSSHVRTPDSQRAISFLAPTEGRMTKVLRITRGAWAGRL